MSERCIGKPVNGTLTIYDVSKEPPVKISEVPMVNGRAHVNEPIVRPMINVKLAKPTG